MLKVMERLSDFNLGQPNMRSLASLKAGSKKRKRSQVQNEWEFDAKITATNACKQVCATVIEY